MQCGRDLLDALSQKRGSTVTAGKDWCDKSVDFINLTEVQQTAEQTAASFHEQVCHLASAKFIQQRQETLLGIVAFQSQYFATGGD